MKNRLYTYYIFFALYYAVENKINYGEDCIRKSIPVGQGITEHI